MAIFINDRFTVKYINQIRMLYFNAIVDYIEYNKIKKWQLITYNFVMTKNS